MRTEQRRGQGWAGSYHAATALIVAGVILPPTAALAIPGRWFPLTMALGLAVVAAGLALLVMQTSRDLRRPAETLANEVRAAADRIDHCVARAEILKTDFAAFDAAMEEEQRNLGMVAGGLGELRQIVRQDRQDFGMVAEEVHDLHGSLRRLDERSGAAQVEATERLDDLAARVGALAGRQDDMQGELAHERRNLGMVAGALDDLRRLTAGVHLFDARQAAFEDTLIEIADQIDGIGGGVSRSLDPRTGAQEPDA